MKAEKIEISKDILVEINNNELAPNKFFKIVKSKSLTKTDKVFKANLETVASQIMRAKDLGQKNLLEKLAFHYKILLKEQLLFSKGIRRYIYGADLLEFIENVKDKTVKCIELERYQRMIPTKNSDVIKKVRNYEIFDEFVVVFTDLSGMKSKDYQSKEDKEYVEKNKDPIVFGIFKNTSTAETYSKFYFITDWEDEYCHLTFDRMVDTIQDGISESYVAPQIDIDEDYINEIIEHVQDPVRLNSGGLGFSIGTSITTTPKTEEILSISPSKVEKPIVPPHKLLTFLERIKGMIWKIRK